VKLSARRFSLAPLATSLVLAFSLGLGIPQVRGAAQSAHAQETDRASALLRWWDAEDRGDIDTAVAQFADGAVYIGTMPSGNCSAQTPCTDLAGIRQQIQRNGTIHFCTSIHWLQVSGAVVTGEREIYSDYDHSIGVERIVQDFIAVVPQDKITFIAGVLNVGDPETALAAAIDAGTQQAGTPILPPTTPCAAVS
jgi:hypothetical protein